MGQPALTTAGGNVMGFPDVCKTPTPVGTIPTPYPNTAMPETANPVTQKVLIDGMPVVTLSSKIQPTNGDQAGVAGGVVSGQIMGEADFIMGTVVTTFEGKPGIFVNSPSTHNKTNTVGTVKLAAQTKVMVS